jgi:NAD(P)-dependent dehydrogenase (short-subunit alcohol dehydrogenase family)
MRRMTELAGHVCVVTGATRGIGRATAEALAQLGATVVVHGRDARAVDRTCHAIAESAGNANVTGVVADLSALAEVRGLAREILSRHERLDVLINNAGLGAVRRLLTADGFERQLAVNHLAPFLLTNLLLDRLKASAPARIVVVSSMAYRRSGLDFEDLNWERRKYNGLEAYGASKLANILFTLELARRLEGTGVTANCLHPGVVATNIFGSMGVFGKLFGALAKPMLLSPADGAKTTVYLASSPEVAAVSGRFFDKCRETALAPETRDRKTAQRLWSVSERLTGLAS